MLGTITPLGERSRGNSYMATAVSYAVGSTLGGLALGTLLAVIVLWARSLLSDVTDTLRLSMAGSAFIGAAFLDWSGATFPVPRRQVSKGWPSILKGWAYGLGFGFQLGFGFATVVNTALLPIGAIVAVVSGSPGLCLSFGLLFGLGRGLLVFLSWKLQSQSQLLEAGRQVDRSEAAARLSVGICTLVLGSVCWVASVTHS